MGESTVSSGITHTKFKHVCMHTMLIIIAPTVLSVGVVWCWELCCLFPPTAYVARLVVSVVMVSVAMVSVVRFLLPQFLCHQLLACHMHYIPRACSQQLPAAAAGLSGGSEQRV